MEANTKSKKEIQNYIKEELTSILIHINPEIDKKDFRKTLKKAGKILFQGSTKKRKRNHPIEIISAPEIVSISVD